MPDKDVSMPFVHIAELIHAIEKIRQTALFVNHKDEDEAADICHRYCKNSGKLCFVEGDMPWICKNFKYIGEPDNE